MWVHIVLLVLVIGLAVAWKIGWLKIEGLDNEKGKRLFLLVAIGGNLLGLCLTLTSGEFKKDRTLVRSEDLTYEQKFQVSVEDGESGPLYIAIPEKESEKVEETEKPADMEESWKQDLRDAVVLYNEENEDPDYYYLPEEPECHGFLGRFFHSYYQ